MLKFIILKMLQFKQKNSRKFENDSKWRLSKFNVKIVNIRKLITLYKKIILMFLSTVLNLYFRIVISYIIKKKQFLKIQFFTTSF